MGFKDKSEKKSSFGRSTGGSGDKVYTLQVTLGARSECTLEVAGSHTLEQLHDAIDGAFDRMQRRTWEFQTGRKGQHDSLNRRYAPADQQDDRADDAAEAALEDLKLKIGGTFRYAFDLDAPLEHAIEVTNVARAGRPFSDPRVLKTTGAPAPSAGKKSPARPRATQTAGRAAHTASDTPDTPSYAADTSADTHRTSSYAAGTSAGTHHASSYAAGTSSNAASEEASAGAAFGAPAHARDPQAAACSYILVALLQRLENVQPGLTADLLAGIEADRAAVSPATPGFDHIDKVFDAALETVRQARAGIA